MSKLASSRHQINIKKVKDGVLVLPGHRYRIILETSALNFELNSESEQDALIETFEHALNALPCPIQILVRVRGLDVDAYIEGFEHKRKSEQNPLFQEQLSDYCSFVRGLVAGNRVLSRRFYIVIPFDDQAHTDMTVVKEQLQLQKEVISKELEKLGLKTRQLPSLEVLQLFYSFYNPSRQKSQPLTQETIRDIEASML